MTKPKIKKVVTYLAQPGMKPRKIFTVVTKPEPKTDLEKRFDPLFERMSKADISLNRPGFYRKLRQELKREREEAEGKGGEKICLDQRKK